MHIQVGVDPRLRELAQQLLLAVTNAEAIEEAVLVLMTDAAADTAAQVMSAAEQLTPLMEQAPAAQAWLLIFLSCCTPIVRFWPVCSTANIHYRHTCKVCRDRFWQSTPSSRSAGDFNRGPWTDRLAYVSTF